MTNKEEFLSNLKDLGGNNFESFYKGVNASILRECKFSMDANSWNEARTAGYTFDEVINNTSDKVFNLLKFITIGQTFLDPESNIIFINLIKISSLFRPSGGVVHTEGRGLDITVMKLNISSSEVVFNNVSGGIKEPELALSLRQNLIFKQEVVQLFSPWWIEDGRVAGRPNDRTTPNDKIHLNHLHFTLKKDSLFFRFRRAIFKLFALR